MLVSKDKVELKDCVFVGNVEQIDWDVLQGCYIIPRENIDEVVTHLQGRKHIMTKAIYD